MKQGLEINLTEYDLENMCGFLTRLALRLFQIASTLFYTKVQIKNCLSVWHFIHSLQSRRFGG